MNPAGDRPDAILQRVLLLLAPAIAMVVGTEFIVVGLLPRMAADLDLPLATAGQLTAWFALAAAVAGPFVTLVASRRAPRAVLIVVLLLYAAGNAVVAITSSFVWMLVARIAQGAMLPAFISVGAAEVARLAAPDARGQALARANLGFVLGVLMALPAGIALAQRVDWRLPFGVLAVAPVLMAGGIAALFPRSHTQASAPAAHAPGLLRNGVFVAHLLLSAVLFAAMFSAYTFLGVWLERVMGLDGDGVALALLVFGAVGLAGNSLAGRVADRAPLRATVVAVLVLAVSVNAATWSHGLLAAAVPLALWSLTHTAGVTLSQVRVTLAGAGAPAFAMTLNVSAANLGIALGALAGGWAIDRWSLSALGVIPAILAVLVGTLAYGIDTARNLRMRGEPCRR